MLNTGSSATIGSCEISAISRPLIARSSRPARHYRETGPRQRDGAGLSARCGENRGEHGAAGSRATGTGAAVGALAAVIVETFRRVEIKHAVRRKSFRAMRNFHVNVAGAVRRRPAWLHGRHVKRPPTATAAANLTVLGWPLSTNYRLTAPTA